MCERCGQGKPTLAYWKEVAAWYGFDIRVSPACPPGNALLSASERTIYLNKKDLGWR